MNQSITSVPLRGTSGEQGSSAQSVARWARAAELRVSARRRAAGVTLVEVLIVVAIMAMIAGGVTVFALPKYKEAQISTAKTSAQVLRRAIQDWQRVNNEVTCPSESELIQGKHLDTGANTDDPWGQQWSFQCTDDDVFVHSSGPDKKEGTADDIVVPKVRSEAEG